MLSNAKALLAKSWKNECADLPVGRHNIDETLLVRVRGHIRRARYHKMEECVNNI